MIDAPAPTMAAVFSVVATSAAVAAPALAIPRSQWRASCQPELTAPVPIARLGVHMVLFPFPSSETLVSPCTGPRTTKRDWHRKHSRGAAARADDQRDGAGDGRDLASGANLAMSSNRPPSPCLRPLDRLRARHMVSLFEPPSAFPAIGGIVQRMADITA
jgi:hypothetical protein